MITPTQLLAAKPDLFNDWSRLFGWHEYEKAAKEVVTKLVELGDSWDAPFEFDMTLTELNQWCGVGQEVLPFSQWFEDLGNGHWKCSADFVAVLISSLIPKPKHFDTKDENA